MQLTCQVIERILDDPQLDGERITIEVQNRVVSLFGTVSSLYARVAAADLARSTPGVVDICNRLQLARSADVTDGWDDPRPDPFDDLVAHWDDGPEQPEQASQGRSVTPRTLDRAAILVALVAAVLWVVLLPRFGGAGLLAVLPVVAAAMMLALRAGHRQEQAGNDDPASPDQISS